MFLETYKNPSYAALLTSSGYLLDFALEILASHQVRNIVVVVIVSTLLLPILAPLLLLHGLVALGEFPERGKGVRA